MPTLSDGRQRTRLHWETFPAAFEGIARFRTIPPVQQQTSKE
jgi:hypothetical protein